MQSLKRLAAYYLNYPCEFSVLGDIFGYPAPPRTLSLRARLAVLDDFAVQRKALIQSWIINWLKNQKKEDNQGDGDIPQPPGNFGYFSSKEKDYTPRNISRENQQYAFRRIAAGLMALKDIDAFNENYDPAPPPDFAQLAEEWIVNEYEALGEMGSTEKWWKPKENRPTSHDMELKEITSLLYVFRDLKVNNDNNDKKYRCGCEDENEADKCKHLLTDNACFSLINKGFKQTELLTGEYDKHLTYEIPVPGWAHALVGTVIAGGILGLFNATSALGSLASLLILAGAAFVEAVLNRLSFSETENHVLMSYTSIHLARQWVRENPRNDPRLEQGNYTDIDDSNDDSNLDGKIEDLLMQATGRFLHSGFFETNARSYWAFSVQALLNIQSFSASSGSGIRTAATNALDYACACGAFRSWNGRVYSPFRRNNGSAEDVKIFSAETIMLATALGRPPWDETFWLENKGNPAGFSLWYKLTGYRPHEVITEFAAKNTLFEDNKGYWARMQARYTSNHYRRNHPPGYFNEDKTIFGAGKDIHSTPEFCFVHKEFFNTGGGRFDRYKVDFDNVLSKLFRKSPTGTHEYDFLARPQVAFFDKQFLEFNVETRDFIPADKEDDDKKSDRHKRERKDDMRKKVMFMFGHRNFWLSDNSGIYKGFTYGYFKARNNHQRHSNFPMNIPHAWENRRLEIDGNHVLRNSADSRVVFTFYDLGEAGNPGPYVVTGRVSKSKDKKEYRAYSRGFWELVPSSRFASVNELKDWVLDNNPDSQFSNSTEGESRFYLYTMTTGETLQLNDLLGYANNKEGEKLKDSSNPIRKIWAAGADPTSDAPLRLADVAVNHMNVDDVNSMPLLQVREVDNDFVFTGRLYAFAKGDGLLRVSNPYLNWEILIDSADYTNPTRIGKPIED